MQITDLKTLDYPPLTNDLEEAKSHLDKYGMALIKDVLSQEEVEEMDQRLNEQFCLLYTSPSPRDKTVSRMPSSA